MQLLLYNQSSVEDEIERAEQALSKGDTLREKNPPGAITQYRNAWVHAQRALDEMDWAVEPDVTITTREDLPRNGTVNYTIRGEVFDVRGHELDSLTLSHEGENRTVELNVNTTPGTVGTFETNVTLDEPVTRINVSATDPNVAFAPHEDDGSDPATEADVLRLDGDGLPDEYEIEVVGTDPLDPDSDSNRTDRNESQNGVVDGAEDFDNDSVLTYY